MTDAADPIPSPPADPALDRAERRLARLSELADLALELARAEQRRALEVLAAEGATPEAAPAKPGRAADPREGFHRAARTLRLTLALQVELEADLVARRQEAQARARAAAPKPPPQNPPVKSPLQTRKDVLWDCIEQAIDAEEDDPREGLLLGAELRERLDREGEAEALLNRPIGVLVAEICAELGLKPDWSLWEQEDWAIAETLARTEGSPYAAPPYDRRRRDRPEDDPDRLIDATLRRMRELKGGP